MLVPVTATWEEMGLDGAEMERAYKPVLDRYGEAARGKTAGALMLQGRTYEEVWGKMDSEKQDSSMGKVRADLLRKGNLKWDDLVTKEGDLVTLKKLVSTDSITEKQLHNSRVAALE